MSLAYIAAGAILLIVLTFASYIDRLYSEMGKFLAREFQENIDAWEQLVEPKIKLGRERIALSASVLTHLSIALLTLLFAAALFDRDSIYDRPTVAEVGQVVLGIVLVIMLFNQLLPFVFFTRTRGVWVAKVRWLIRTLIYCALPVTFFLSFLLSIAALAETPRRTDEETTSEGVEALIEAGEEEGILEESDRDLVRSAVEFGDKVAREVMTPRPSVFAVATETTIEAFLTMLAEHPFSRVPVFKGTLDTVTGIVFAHDLLQISDADAHTRTVGSIERVAAFVPETKKVNELLREMQREKQHMRIVIDEYGGVAGIVTIEDLLEEIVGSISDEHETESVEESIVREPDGALLVPGSFELAQLEQILPDALEGNEEMEATTVGGWVSEIAGRIPLPGEVIEESGLRFEVLASTDRRIVRVKVSRIRNEE
ncbi:hemolysin family protein [Acidipila rosea]|uniref:CBS domain containing-hemolysin-like protein n=1 Tax=Acidipila rosea TaxID=768535 RepID=A0A4R1LAC5_9BACT|nr:hemolysin family protein [Acidipila rosea]MBW4027073.1 HlyC/CorC family transporter [Acidobacteriota bacterium]MBW4045141.1 HlyC/CorC family transporter [Acidobacteriota bacterium]TCK75376.1 CBS domain containing-hemolysin-like protein [Acidipila rosea]